MTIYCAHSISVHKYLHPLADLIYVNIEPSDTFQVKTTLKLTFYHYSFL
jgi:hypothetical protein